MKTALALSPTLWVNASRVKDWLRTEYWPRWRADDVWHDFDRDNHWYWVVPDYERGRSRVLGIDGELLEEVTLHQIEKLLRSIDWKGRLEEAPLLIRRNPEGELQLGTWAIQLPEAWFEDPRGGYFRAFVTQRPSMMSGAPPAPTDPFLALHGATWSSAGPRNPADPSTYSRESLERYIPAREVV